MSKSTIEILEGFFPTWTVKRQITSLLEQSPGVAVMKVCDPLWLTPCIGFQLDSVLFEVVSITKISSKEFDIVFNFSGPIPTATEYETLPIPFKNGQPERLNYEENQPENLAQFLRIYLFELFPEDVNVGTDSSIDHVDRVKLFALIDYDKTVADIESLTKQSYEPMRRLLKLLADRLYKREGFQKILRARLWQHPDFGIVKTEDPNDQNYKTGKSIINRPLSGVELEMTIEVLFNCDECIIT